MIIMAERDGAFFLDTSTQISKHWEDPNIRLFLSQELPTKYCYSSVYVKNEYKYRILNDSILAYNVIVKSDTLAEAESRLNATMSPDSLPCKAFSRYARDLKSKEKVLQRIEKVIDCTWEMDFGAYIESDLFDLTECKYAQMGPSKHGNLYLDIKDTCPSDCNICEFLRTKHSDVKLLSHVDTSTLDSTTDHKGTLQKIKSVSTAILGGASAHGTPCKEMSDAVIAIEAKASDPTIILHSMDSDFKLLGEVLNIPTCVRSKHKIPK